MKTRKIEAPFPFELTDPEWRQRLTPQQYAICRQGGTEFPNTGEYLHHTADGIYECAACGQPLFESKTKYDACGWPSYWDALPASVQVHPDLEAVCTRCGSHLGHRFNDGPRPTGFRY
jgi:peptide-methionine (R)-S-oxide reductase